MTTAAIFASWKRLGDAVRELISLKVADAGPGVSLSADDVEKKATEIVRLADLEISRELQARSILRPREAGAAEFSVTLAPGTYIVNVHPSHATRVWKHQGEGVFVGHGSKLRKAAIAYAINDLISKAEEVEGIKG
jgi:hypothetical protein